MKLLEKPNGEKVKYFDDRKYVIGNNIIGLRIEWRDKLNDLRDMLVMILMNCLCP